MFDSLLYDINLFYYLADFCRPIDILQLSKTSKQIRKFVNFDVWFRMKVERKLKKYHSDPKAFLNALEKSGDLISGGFLTQLLLNEDWKESDLDIFSFSIRSELMHQWTDAFLRIKTKEQKPEQLFYLNEHKERIIREMNSQSQVLKLCMETCLQLDYPHKNYYVDLLVNKPPIFTGFKLIDRNIWNKRCESFEWKECFAKDILPTLEEIYSKDEIHVCNNYFETTFSTIGIPISDLKTLQMKETNFEFSDPERYFFRNFLLRKFESQLGLTDNIINFITVSDSQILLLCHEFHKTQKSSISIIHKWIEKQFDLDFSKCTYDGKRLRIFSMSSISQKRSEFYMLPRNYLLEKQTEETDFYYYDKFNMLQKLINKRIKKYLKRGFKINLPLEKDETVDSLSFDLKIANLINYAVETQSTIPFSSSVTLMEWDYRFQNYKNQTSKSSAMYELLQKAFKKARNK